MDTTNLYKHAHLLIAAIRVLEHQLAKPPAIEDTCQMLSLSIEQGNYVCRKLDELGAIDVVEGAFGTRLFIKDHLIIEDIPKGEQESGLEEALKTFQSSRKNQSQKIAAIKADQDQKKKDLFADLEKKLKTKLKK